ncbi:Sap, sulfolipid-1-addressing protein [Nocardia amikacinitolerans]|uniref:Sap, sulfolipid-1-addressing protein n=1 Tax=Nocardia amikacinitolerans TaxID=756689 RepID=A0A285L562_9NOCA|nr:GAP family protein [Nocardia amikacinitolerans]MCP2277749.1 Sap, sulfolipid-1-addressing protein [Nocardia amikacinitolerans]MCP2297914.1 Sap, sulfolipid-1-addressing protein [Nocardia amikacinitolerans]SNY80032.1 Sap, sulfolipid-1-addressing protein [Nocardia amikacinitolerans]
MSTVLGELLPLAVGVAISPIPIVAAILMILSKNAAGAGSGFAVGWVAGIVVATSVVALVAGSLGVSTDREPAAAASWVRVALGVLLLVLAGQQWRNRSDTATPGWMRAMDQLTTGKAAGLGAALAAVNPKNLLLCLSAGVAIGSSGLGAGEKVVAVVVFTVLAAASVLVVVLGYALAADRVRGVLDDTRVWLQTNNHAVMAIVLLVMGAVVLGKGIGGL